MAGGEAVRLAVGLMSGTSLDGIDAALVRLGPGARAVSTLATHHQPYSASQRAELARICNDDAAPSVLARAGVALAELHAEAVLGLLAQARIEARQVSVVGFHGQTVQHLPLAAVCLERSVRASLQIGDAATLAERTGISVVSDFRARDLAAGGEGAPLVPFMDWLLFTDEREGRVALNIGGIANLTFLPPASDGADVIAFDTGPGNSLIDLLAQRMTDGAQACDLDGAIAASGTVNNRLLAELMNHPYFERRPPKSTGKEEFGQAYFDTLLRAHSPSADLMATLTAFTATGIAGAIVKFWAGDLGPRTVIAAGGGVHNPTLMRMLRERLPGMELRTSEEFGISVDFKEAIAFAILADRSVHGDGGNLPSATGARRAVVLGKITPA